MPPSDDDWKKLGKLVDVFYNRPDAEPFREPVDWKALGLFDYPQVVSEPMDLGTVKSRLKTKKYNTFAQVGADVNRIWENCKEYNRAGSDFHKLAVSLQKKWDDRYTKLLAEVRPSADDSEGGKSAEKAAVPEQRATLAERKSFAKSLFNLSKEDVGKILVEIEAKCPMALVRNSSEDEVELNVDKIPAPLLHELSQFVASQKKKKTPGAKRAKTSKQ
mmetsp:Transcript_26135/g.72068  ORF Transcript_26135/g.72068 Transcript_26135/m.72068 type:complete len:218 (+) Transcript_26135:216-869(+)|eukprot:CAMPEP_0168739494 /NCGR_PEP_ID=MMETSP0724-20121128/11492_1 /TAXON_ID=265536 /ORGANISM="Amphiprora sp., Strain CCMP467" /LENGTH=217 /DNA_ID=CAMNT_0008786899 /DNA_START=216 /DNA_END=869 /DNA_ORIENTATION=+